jgi:tetratricopeptide (TPR) repeat protein
VKTITFIGRIVQGLRNTEGVGVNKQINEGIANQTTIINDRLGEIWKGINNQSTLLNNKLSEIIESLVNEQRIINDNMTKILDRLQNSQTIKLLELAAIFMERQCTLENTLNKLIDGSLNQRNQIAAELTGGEGEQGSTVGEQERLDGPPISAHREAVAGGELGDSTPVAEREAMGRSHVQQSQTLMQAGHFKAALAEARLAQAIDPHNPDCCVSLSQSLLALEDFETAERDLRDACEVFPDHAQLWGLLATASWNIGDHAAALNAIDRAGAGTEGKICNSQRLDAVQERRSRSG